GEDADASAGVGHGPEFGEPFAGQPDGDGPDGTHVDPAAALAQVVDLLDDAGGVGDRGGVGHGVHGGEPAAGGGPGAGLDGFGVLASGFAQVGVQIDHAGQGDEPGGVDDLGGRGRRMGGRLLAGGGDHPAVEQQVGGGAAGQGGAADQVGGAHVVLD